MWELSSSWEGAEEIICFKDIKSVEADKKWNRVTSRARLQQASERRRLTVDGQQ